MRIVKDLDQVLDIVRNEEPVWVLTSSSKFRSMTLKEVEKLVAEDRLGRATNESIESMFLGSP